jgi:hypothetical protein
MEKLYEPEIIHSINGLGWTVIRYGRDEKGPYQEWIGENYSTFLEAEKAALLWKCVI